MILEILAPEPWPEAQARADEIVAAMEALRAEKDRRRDLYGVTAAYAAEDAAGDAIDAALTQIRAFRSRSVSDILAKARFGAEMAGGELLAQRRDNADTWEEEFGLQVLIEVLQLEATA